MQVRVKEAQLVEQSISISKLRPSRYQTRHVAFENDEELQDLAMSIKSMGLLEPPKVRRLEQNPGYFEIITGHRRIKAISRYLGWSEVKCQVEDGLSEIETFRLALAENIQRTNLSPYEEGQAYLLCEKLFGLSDQDIAENIHKSKPTVMLRRQLAADANKYLRYCNDPRITNLFLQNFNLRHRRILKKIGDKQNLSKAVTLIGEGSPIRQIRMFVEGAKKIERHAEDYQSITPLQKREVGDIDDLTDSIVAKVRKLTDQAPTEARSQFTELEKMISNLGYEAKIFRESDLEVVGLDSIKEFSCPNCREMLQVSRRLDKNKNSEILRISSKDRRLAKQHQFIMYPRL